MPLPILFAIGNLIAQFVGALRRAWGDPTSRGLIYSVVLLIAIGTFVFHTLEGWGWVDSLYFTVITLTTVGYGDFAPQTTAGKLFTVLYIILGLGLLASFITLIGTHTQANMQERSSRRPLRQGPRGRRRNKGENVDDESINEVTDEDATDEATSEDDIEETN